MPIPKDLTADMMRMTPEEFETWSKNYELTQAGELDYFATLDDVRALLDSKNETKQIGETNEEEKSEQQEKQSDESQEAKADEAT